MKRFLILLAIVLVPPTATAQPIAFTGVTVIDVEEGTADSGMTVVVTGDRIAAVGAVDEVHVPDDATVVDASGKYLIPGLWDMHVHSSSDRITREVLFPLYIANGVTGVRDLTGDCFSPCSPIESSIDEARRWEEDISSGRLVGPRLVLSSPIIRGPGAGESSSVEAPATEEEARALARRMAERGVDMLKIYDELPREAFFGLVGEAERLGLPVVGHVPLAVRASEAAEAGMRTMEHLNGMLDECSSREDELRPRAVEGVRSGEEMLGANLFRGLASFSAEKCAALYETLARHRVWQVPTLAVAASVARGTWWEDDPRLVYLPAVERDYWVEHLAGEALLWPGGLYSLGVVNYKYREIVLEMHRAGVPLLAGSDVGTPGMFPGFALHMELEALVDAGLTPAEALRASTVGPAIYLETADALGSVEEGKMADLVLLDANPLDDIANTQRIRAVVADGRYLDRAALDALLTDVEQAARE